ncbi:MAG: hypothetical protein M1816_003188 [Peltula sp. TS41687]|nr:MAG: hypothetical protein M1816_003188 [Peltula sp. TS41687]
MVPRAVRKIAIVGAGPAGIAAAKYLLAEETFHTIDIFEQRHRTGGVWNYTSETVDELPTVPQVNPKVPPENPTWRFEGPERRSIFPSAMYDDLETNIPLPLIQFSDLSFPEGTQLFPHREEVLRYLEEYAREILDLIQFETQVLDVRLDSQDKHDIWVVTTKNLVSEQVREASYDAVVIASGHYNVPHIPDIKGISAWNQKCPGAVMHSKLYRTPERFREKTVVIVGNYASGTDIGSQISKVCRPPLLISQRRPSYFPAEEPELRQELPEIAEFLPDQRALRFTNDVIVRDVDAVVFCTGYLYSYPFLSSLQPALISDGLRTQHLYKHIFYMYKSTLAFAAVPKKIIPFPLSESQAAVIAGVWAGRLELPSLEEMKSWEKETLDEGGSKEFHTLGYPLDVDYINELHNWNQQPSSPSRSRRKQPPCWGEKEYWTRERIPAIKKAFLERDEERHVIRSMEQLGFDYDQWEREVVDSSKEVAMS